MVFDQLKTKDEVIESLKESLNSLTNYNHSINRSRSDANLTGDEPDRHFESFLTYDPTTTRLKSLYAVT